jgi:hypothetical protein
MLNRHAACPIDPCLERRVHVQCRSRDGRQSRSRCRRRCAASARNARISAS